MTLQKRIVSIKTAQVKCLIAELEESPFADENFDKVIKFLQSRVSEITQNKDKTSEVHTFAAKTADINKEDVDQVVNFLTVHLQREALEAYKSILDVFTHDKHVIGADQYGHTNVYYFSEFNLPEIYNYVVLTATGEENLYAKLAQNSNLDLHYSDFDADIELKSNIYQCVDKTASRSSMTKEALDRGYLDKFIKFAKKNIETPNLSVITLKKDYVAKHLEAEGLNVSTLVLGAAEGNDDYKGKPLIVVGTFSQPADKYIAIAGALGFTGKGDFQHNVKCEYNNVRFSYSTFTDTFLQKVHFWVVGSALEQAVGRSRASRFKNADVYLLSRFPVRFAVYIRKGNILNPDRQNLSIADDIIRVTKDGKTTKVGLHFNGIDHKKKQNRAGIREYN